MPYRRIVVGTDGSPRAEHAVREAARLAAVARARLIVVAAYTRDDRDAAEQRAADGARVAGDAGATDVHVVSDEGAPDAVLLRVAEAHGADLLVVGSKGMTDASRFVIGSVANTISHHAGCDVLIVRTAATEGDT